MRNKLIYCIPLALSITCLIGCAAKAAQMPAEPEPVALLPEQKQSSIVTNDAKNETIPTPQQSEHEDTPVRIVESTPADTPANADTEVPQAAPVPTTQPNVTEDIPSETVHAKTGYGADHAGLLRCIRCPPCGRRCGVGQHISTHRRRQHQLRYRWAPRLARRGLLQAH